MTIYNLPENHKKYIVVRDVDGDFYYWGSYDDVMRAMTVAVDVDGLVVTD